VLAALADEDKDSAEVQTQYRSIDAALAANMANSVGVVVRNGRPSTNTNGKKSPPASRGGRGGWWGDGWCRATLRTGSRT
jgi:hypothetical protein